MKPLAKAGVVLGGYALAFGLASAAVALREAFTPNAAAQASSGMFAFGDLLTFGAVFAFGAFAPTLLALWFLRPVLRFWTAGAVAAAVLAAAGLASAVVAIVTSGPVPPAPLAALAPWSVLVALASPLLAAAFALAAFLAPARGPRTALLWAAAAEFVAGGGFVAWLVLRARG